MNNLNRHIAQEKYSGIYLLYGEEDYLIRYYRDRLTQGILHGSTDGNINYHYYEGGSVTADDIINQAQSLPFFSDVVLIVVENSGFFKRSTDLASSLEGIPQSTKIIFVEHEVDKRNSLYKYVKSAGTAAELMHKNDNELINWVAAYLKREECLITMRAAKLLISKAGVDMQQLVNELDKLIAYAGEKKQIDIPQVEAIVTTQLSNKIFVMIDNIVDNPEMDSETRVDFIKDIKREIININFLVNSLLKLSKLDVDSVHFIREQVSIKDIIDEAIKNVSVLCDLKNINILVSGNANVKIFCDFKWQVEAITNVIKNCVEHSEVNSKLEIFYDENNIYSEIKIRDYGSGIDKQDLPHIFERFYKGKNSSSESVGIGLALAKSIIESNNGYISVESQVGNGSLFIIKYFKFSD